LFTSQATGWEDWVFAAVKLLAGKIVSEMTYDMLLGMLNSTISIYLSQSLLRVEAAAGTLEYSIGTEHSKKCHKGRGRLVDKYRSTDVKRRIVETGQ